MHEHTSCQFFKMNVVWYLQLVNRPPAPNETVANCSPCQRPRHCLHWKMVLLYGTCGAENSGMMFHHDLTCHSYLTSFCLQCTSFCRQCRCGQNKDPAQIKTNRFAICHPNPETQFVLLCNIVFIPEIYMWIWIQP